MKKIGMMLITAILAAALCMGMALAAEALPAYVYTGADPVEAAVSAWITDSEMAKGYLGVDEGAVTIPAPVILKTGETEDGHLLVYGNFWALNYTLEDDVLVCVSGGECPGIMTLEKDGDGWKTVSLEAAGDGEEYPRDIARFSNGDKELEDAYYAAADGNGELMTSVRTRFIADYVTANNLPVVAYQDPYWDPIDLFASDK